MRVHINEYHQINSVEAWTNHLVVCYLWQMNSAHNYDIICIFALHANVGGRVRDGGVFFNYGAPPLFIISACDSSVWV